MGEITTAEQLHRIAIAEVILRERTARDLAFWEEMASYYHPDSEIVVSWFRGSGAEFVERTKLQYQASRKRSDGMDRLNFHEMGAAVVTVRNDRALAETACTLHSFFPLDGVACKNTAFVRLMWRMQMLDRQWRIAGLRCVYIRDLMTPCNPSEVPAIDQADLDRYRVSYRFTAYHLSRLGLDPKDDLPGADRPETIAALRQEEQAWLEEEAL